MRVSTAVAAMMMVVALVAVDARPPPGKGPKGKGKGKAFGGQPLSTQLTGAAEVGTVGDSDGTGSATVTLNSGLNELCFTLSVDNLALPIRGAHIHQAAEGQNGPVVLFLLPQGAVGGDTQTEFSGCFPDTQDTSDFIDSLRSNPEGFYINVHNADFPAGAIRGQLSTGA
eukprot:m.159440 g.159440  ORF g.159440 m.159440 type:complete len:170 (+) comp11793_c0_seq1:54-563(+)